MLARAAVTGAHAAVPRRVRAGAGGIVGDPIGGAAAAGGRSPVSGAELAESTSPMRSLRIAGGGQTR